MPVMNFDLEDGLPPVSFSLKETDCARMIAFMSECTEALKSQRAAAPTPPAQDETELLKVICERDDAVEWADKLADSIAEWIGVDIGEHSNLNNPWREALDAIETPAQEFSNEDLPLPEDKEILAAHPLNTKDFHSYGEAQRMVSAKHSKFALVDLVNWLLSRIPPAQEAEPVAELTSYYEPGYGAIKITSGKRSLDIGTKLYTRPANDELRHAAEVALSDIEMVYDATDDWVHDSLYVGMCKLRAALDEKS